MAKTLSEKESREQLIGWARKYGAEAQLMKIFMRYDDLLKGCKTAEEREQIQIMGNIEIHDFFGGNGALEVGGKMIREDKEYIAYKKRLAEEEMIKEALTK